MCMKRGACCQYLLFNGLLSWCNRKASNPTSPTSHQSASPTARSSTLRSKPSKR
ncbi:hypothetical protein K443DRAFT_685053 [Laccaria amethystina LaAM-08-1]|uniref:Unplaced genomic scaffold K443scaffold_349, whole genome shotgun sequence n=1 Tax=Laccaria amethystina LaAM-08-1 TaxID=1095629 RepID=A0A0C9X8X7_9AGAR|nr:hypothetical protein K443DRAFT_685050 [Laccaria amethystina LaAM-08-1]KIJ92802.1 hypothetical protein K443DRAFT_685053 [Laccaria amethystina LaAM-08-1]